MSNFDSEPVPEGLVLTSREQVETAWQAAVITGLAPNVGPLLQTLLELNIPSELRTPENHLSFGLFGESGQQAKLEVVASLQAITERLDKESDTTKAASALLAILRQE